MTKLLNQKTAAKLLGEHGWTEGVGGKHNVKMTKPGHRPITAEAQGPGLQQGPDSGDTEAGEHRPQGPMSVETEYIVKVHHEDDGSTWAEVLDLPGCFASGDSMAELWEALGEAVSLYLDDDPDAGNITETHQASPPRVLQLDEMRVRVPA